MILKKIIIYSILLYQKYAPEKMHNKCRFKPTCSNYMKLAVIKYGFIKGIILGINRILKYHPPNGGEDYP